MEADQAKESGDDEVEERKSGDDCKTAAFLSELPMEHEHMMIEYFMRDCYATYYNLIIKIAHEKISITITETQGTTRGKAKSM